MPWTTDDVEKLERKIASARERVALGDTSVQYAAIEKMMAVRKSMLDEIAAASPATKRKRVIRLTQTGTGL